MTSTICLIDTSPAVDEALINKITTILPKSVTVKKRTYIQAIAGIPPEVIAIVFIFVSASLARGFLEELGNDAYNRLKSTLRNYPSKERERTLVLDFKSKRTKISFRCETDEPAVLDAALEAIPSIIERANKTASYFVSKSGDWELSRVRKTRYVGNVVIATTERAVVNGLPVQFTERALREVAKNLGPNFPLMAEHRGTPVGRVTKSWFKDGKLFARVEVYKPRNPEEIEIVRRIKSGELRGMSLAGSF